MSDSVRVEVLVASKTKEELLQEGRSAPLAVAERIHGDGNGEAEYGTDLEWKHAGASVRISASARLRCGSDTQRMLAGMDHCKSIVQSVLAAEVGSVNRLLSAIGGSNAGTSGD